MRFQLYPPLAFRELGQRDNNEDCIFPEKGKGGSETELFLVCDGMGGLDKGELASQIVIDTVTQYLLNRSKNINEELIHSAVKTAHNALELELKKDSLLNRMGSTLTLLALNTQGAIIAHIGDSRVYHIRDGKILYKTRDHKQVLDMVDDGIITFEQAKTHPWRNRLSRSISVKRHTTEDEFRTKYDKPVVKFIEDIQINDYFFMCTDGVLEQIDDETLINLLSTKENNNQQKLEQILELCKGKTKDNYSGYLLQIKSIVDIPFVEEKTDSSIPINNMIGLKNYVIVAIFFLIAALTWAGYDYFKNISIERSLPKTIKK
ncbi:MAG: serine/threonine-protein phosphatase [Cytophagaceae bacterium]|nr:serine/threonine-protein phosphatase [Cytophagaceae bacterium]